MHVRRHLGWLRVLAWISSFPCLVPCTIAGAVVSTRRYDCLGRYAEEEKTDINNNIAIAIT